LPLGPGIYGSWLDFQSPMIDGDSLAVPSCARKSWLGISGRTRQLSSLRLRCRLWISWRCVQRPNLSH